MFLFSLFANPYSLYAGIEAKPNWVKPFAVITLLAFVTLALLYPINQHLLMRQIANLDAARLNSIQSALRMSGYFSLVLAPVRQLIVLSLMAYFLYLTLMVSGFQLCYRKVLALSAYASVFASLDALWGSATNFAHGIDNIKQLTDIQTTFLGAAAFIDLAQHPLLRELADSLSPLSLWYWSFLILGISWLTKISKLRAAGCVAPLWACQVAVHVIAQLLGRMMEQMR